jgi:hypothetical protein
MAVSGRSPWQMPSIRSTVDLKFYSHKLAAAAVAGTAHQKGDQIAAKHSVWSPPRKNLAFCLYQHDTDEFPLMCADLHELLAAAYSEYDIIIWSATG